MNGFELIEEKDLLEIDGGAVFEIMIGTKVFTGLAAVGIASGAGVVLVGVAALGFYVASKN